MSKRVDKRKERERRVKKMQAKEKHRRASQPPPPMPVELPNLGITLHFVDDEGREIGSETITLFDGLKVPR